MAAKPVKNVGGTTLEQQQGWRETHEHTEATTHVELRLSAS
jgi:hypothetical protein